MREITYKISRFDADLKQQMEALAIRRDDGKVVVDRDDVRLHDILRSHHRRRAGQPRKPTLLRDIRRESFGVFGVFVDKKIAQANVDICMKCDQFNAEIGLKPKHPYKVPCKAPECPTCSGVVDVTKHDCPKGKWRTATRRHKSSAVMIPPHLMAVERLRGVGRGRVLVMVANGPSHAESDLPRLAKMRTIDTMSINVPDKRIWPTNYWVYVDQSRRDLTINLEKDYKGVLLNTNGVDKPAPNAIILPHFPGKPEPMGFSWEPSAGIWVGCTTTYVGLQLAAYMQYDHVYVFGVDMGRGKDGTLYATTTFPGGHNPSVEDQERENRFAEENETFEWMGECAPRTFVNRVTFCSNYNRRSFLRHFEHLSHDEAVGTIVKRIALNDHRRIIRHNPAVVVTTPPITIITCTGARPEAFALCEKYVKRALEKYKGDAQWIVVDDGEVPTATTMDQFVIRPDPLWDGRNTLPRNMFAALEEVKNDFIFVVEDDDWYSPDYFLHMMSLLQQYPIVGERDAWYYNVAKRCYNLLTSQWASMCQTGMKRDQIPALRVALQRQSKYADMELWQTVNGSAHLFSGKRLCVGIKGMPGRVGLGSGHVDVESYTPDKTLSVLRGWIGDDADSYQRFFVE